ncbi:hypothetical protein M0R45_025878 [Rubus argutus]|uniref:Uncharacterized protein n=1 Tax=Rubus argutus TaxID=59490 RepID=A0AAW1WXN9_RUBAR
MLPSPCPAAASYHATPSSRRHLLCPPWTVDAKPALCSIPSPPLAEPNHQRRAQPLYLTASPLTNDTTVTITSAPLQARLPKPVRSRARALIDQPSNPPPLLP